MAVAHHVTGAPTSAKGCGAAPIRIAAAVGGFSEGLDAAALGATIGRATRGQLMLVAVHSEPIVVLPQGLDWKSTKAQAERSVRSARIKFAPEARTVVETDVSPTRGLQRVIRREHRDLLVVGSSRHATDGHVRIGKRTRQLLSQFECPVAVAPRGLHEDPLTALSRIGVGYDGGPEAEAALTMASAIAVAAGSELWIRSLAEDKETAERLRTALEADPRALGAKVKVEVRRGRPATSLLGLAEHVDLMLIGSRRWGPVKRLVLGSTGEAMLHDAGCAVLVVPRARS